MTETKSTSAIVKNSVASMLLAASEFTANTSWKIEMIAKVKRFIQNDFDQYLQICTARRESVLSRLSGSPERSKEVLERFIEFKTFRENDRPESPSPIEKVVARKKSFALGRISKNPRPL